MFEFAFRGKKNKVEEERKKYLKKADIDITPLFQFVSK